MSIVPQFHGLWTTRFERGVAIVHTIPDYHIYYAAASEKVGLDSSRAFLQRPLSAVQHWAELIGRGGSSGGLMGPQSTRPGEVGAGDACC
jgi:hypothetical protein